MALLLTSLINSWMFINKPILYSWHSTTDYRQTCLISSLSLFVSILSVFVSVLFECIAWKGYLHWSFALFCNVTSKSVLVLILCILALVVWLANLLVDWLTYWLIGILLYRQEWFVCFLHVFSTTCAMLLLALFCVVAVVVSPSVCYVGMSLHVVVCVVLCYFKWCCVVILQVVLCVVWHITSSGVVWQFLQVVLCVVWQFLQVVLCVVWHVASSGVCLLYTSDAADER